jgi:hypothetical protein
MFFAILYTSSLILVFNASDTAEVIEKKIILPASH